MQDATVLKNSICQITDFHEYLRIAEVGGPWVVGGVWGAVEKYQLLSIPD